MTRMLHGSQTSPFVRVARMLLHEKGLDTERETTLTAERDTGELAKLNPMLRVPILEDNGRVLVEVRIIAEYLLATYPDARIVSYNPATDTYTDHGTLNEEEWPQYPRPLLVVQHRQANRTGQVIFGKLARRTGIDEGVEFGELRDCRQALGQLFGHGLLTEQRF